MKYGENAPIAATTKTLEKQNTAPIAAQNFKIMKNPKRKYNAIYRLRKKGFKTLTPAKTIFTPFFLEINSEMKILLSEFHFIIQTEMF